MIVKNTNSVKTAKRNNIKHSITVLFLTISSLISAQESIDFLKIRKELVRTSCSEISLDTVELTLKNLLSIDSTKITEGLAQYYYDLGMTYLEKSLIHEQKEFLPQMILNFQNCISVDKKYHNAYLNLSIYYHSVKQYDLAKSYIVNYKKYCKKKYWDKDFIEMLEKI